MTKNRNFSPFITATIAIILGIYAQSFELFSPAILLIALAISSLILLACAIKSFHSIITQVITCLTFLALGGMVLTLQKNQHTDLARKFDGKRIDVIAKVTNKKILPTTRKSDWKEIIEIDIQQTKTHYSQIYTKSDFKLQCYSIESIDVQVDDLIELEDIKIKIPQDQTLSENTSYKNYLIKEGLLASVFFYKPKIVKILYTPKFGINRFIWNIRNDTYQRLKTKIKPKVFPYFSLIFLGNTQHKETDKMRNTFNYWGISHYLARSGLHIVLFILIWTIFLQLIPISIKLKRIILILICLIYKIFSWTSLPFTRAFYAFILTEAGKLFNLQTDFLHLLSIVCATILLLNPMQLFFLDFQLTFALTFALAFTSKFIH